MPRLALVFVLALVVAIPAFAADPDKGTVSGASPEVTWSGGMDGDITTGAMLVAFGEQGGTDGYCETDPFAVCDVFTLTVDDPGTKLSVTATADDDVGTMAVEIIPPEGGGDSVYAYEAEASQTAAIEKPIEGVYTVNVLGAPNNPIDVVTYKASAKLEGAAAPQPSTTATPDPPAQTTPAPTPEPAPAAPAPGPPPPPAQAGPRSLAMHADRRRVRTAVRYGFRTRLVCRGGCQKLKVKAYISALTARNLRIGNFSGDVEVGGARILRDAEGRRQTVVTFRPSYRKRLARARRLTLALEAIATDPDGQVRTLNQRVTFRR